MTLEIIIVAVVLAMVVGLFDPLVDNREIFKILSPAFQQIVAALIGLVGYEFGKRANP